MTEQERIQEAAILVGIGVARLDEAKAAADPVARRRCIMRAAKAMRSAADVLDDHGHMQE